MTARRGAQRRTAAAYEYSAARRTGSRSREKVVRAAGRPHTSPAGCAPSEPGISPPHRRGNAGPAQAEKAQAIRN